MDLEEKVNQYFFDFGPAAVDLVMKRYQLGDRKRGLFTIRYVSQDPVEEKELTEKMDQITLQIKEIDDRLMAIGINQKLRIQIIKDIKKFYANGAWTSGFSEEL